MPLCTRASLGNLREILRNSRAGLFAKSKNVMLSHLFADVVEEESAGGKGGGGGKKKGGGSMQTISATHRVSPFLEKLLLNILLFPGTIE